MKKKINIAILGFGTVGSALYELIQKLPESNITVSAIGERSPYKLPADLQYLFSEPEEIIINPKIDLVVELTSSNEEAYTLVNLALQQGKTVVSANKKMLATHLKQLRIPQYKNKLWYEAAACGSIPIFRIVQQYYNAEPISKIRGVFNGTSNYILSEMETVGLSFAEALQQAQRKGFAEANPSDDIDGFDTFYKLQLLCYEIWGPKSFTASYSIKGIRSITRDDIEKAKKDGKKIKLLAQAQWTEQGIEVTVTPTWVSKPDSAYNCSAENNVVEITGAWSGVQYYAGKGAGGLPTAKAVLQDITDVFKQTESLLLEV